MENSPVTVVEEASPIEEAPIETTESAENKETELPTEPTINQ
jgi:hypothetical protein